MLPLEIIKKYYPDASEDELKDIQEVVYLLACAVMQQFYEPERVRLSAFLRLFLPKPLFKNTSRAFASSSLSNLKQV